MSQGLRIIFAGTPDFAAEHLKILLGSRHQVIAAYSQPDRPAGRGKKLTASPVKELAVANNIPVYQPVNFKTPESISELAALNADLMAALMSTHRFCPGGAVPRPSSAPLKRAIARPALPLCKWIWALIPATC
jgi:methionyl-tRNA formyltransferase